MTASHCSNVLRADEVWPQNRSLLASSLQTAHNLRVLPSLVQSLLSDLTDAVEQRIKIAFDMARISKEVNAKGTSLTLGRGSQKNPWYYSISFSLLTSRISVQIPRPQRRACYIDPESGQNLRTSRHPNGQQRYGKD